MEYLIGLIILIADIWAIISSIQSPTTPNGWKVFWVVLILFLPIIGFIIWLVAGPRAPKARRI